jgi:hypothetical protein
MTRSKPRFTKDQVLERFRILKKENPRVSSTQLANDIGCKSAYVRATLARAGIALPRSPKKQPSLCGINQGIQQKKVEKTG